jgi:hypothetical protein
MKTLKVLCAATVLALSLSLPVYAGDVQDPGKPHASYEIPKEVEDTESTELTTVDSDFSLSAVVDMLWTVASIF